MTSTTDALTCRPTEAAELAGLAPEWGSLHAGTPEASPFAHPAWYATWMTHFPPSAARFLALRDGSDTLAAVIPLTAEGGVASGLGNPKIQDYTGALIREGLEGPVAAGLLEWLAAETMTGLRLWGIPAGSALIEALRRAADEQGWTMQAEPEAVAPAAAVGDDWEQFLASLSKKNRHELRRKLRNLEAAGAIEFETISEPERVRETVASLLEMMRSSHEGKTRFLTPQMESFFAEVGPAMAAAGSGRTWRLTLDGREIAILLGFDGPTTRFLYNSGYDPDYGHLAVGLLSKALAMKAGSADGLLRFDFLRGNEDYKRRLGGVEQPILRLELSRG